MKCPCCGAAELIPDTRDIQYIYKGETTVIPKVTGEFCPACGEVILNRKHGDRYSDLMGQFQRQVNSAYVDPAHIAKVRKKLEYENGKTKPPLSLMSHPEIVEPKEKTLGDVPRLFQALGKYFVGGRPEFEEIERNWCHCFHS
ncbi:YgiT-type zinc finger protein [Verminephrobacter aporrectodeae subsp. tuberculatae]|uniref:YgiT-type zinc finger protein n=1 Tax=Verminephrobacter aporrectodeae subsp. tuberculatae TaxID=1110392 RepID=A0ABT3KRD3_9BURK|nr:type II toxin-antitoxin system MqsA family antitoxin [Verminephrobacter aporrectodeae]MCW5320861.1 YgiT-type zinc finger protein [Verminephrobacter aporrectodeae subsp. tuberculatae]